MLLSHSAATKTAPVNAPSEEETGEDGNEDTGLVKLTKAEKRAKLKKIRKEGKKQGKEVAKEEVKEAPQAAVLVFPNLFNNTDLAYFGGPFNLLKRDWIRLVFGSHLIFNIVLGQNKVFLFDFRFLKLSQNKTFQIEMPSIFPP
jgi:hypothetical protein